ncbi:hypothetical protein ACL02R_27490 [Streptomyces sp. MS19]|uniref:hypothetical protein n=1 Tax=Streptomyces sp. MS19 TaxID=3385972 RepID=UPI0039A1BCC1
MISRCAASPAIRASTSLSCARSRVRRASSFPGPERTSPANSLMTAIGMPDSRSRLHSWSHSTSARPWTCCPPLVRAATSPLLDGHGGAYCRDCGLARPAEGDDMLVGGVKPWARDREAAARLWVLSAELTGVDAWRP